MVNFGFEADTGALEGEVVEFELDDELPSLEGRCLWTNDGDVP